MSIQESLKIVPRGDIAIIEFDLVGEKVNKLSGAVMDRFDEVVKELEKSKYKAAVFISRKKNMFIAGADIDEIRKFSKKEEIMPLLTRAHGILNRFEDLKMPTIAAIHGPCLGGGYELALACDYRIASEESVTKVGLPEIMLGIFPGFGGCVRLPKLIGLPGALDIILAGKSVPGKKAAKIGMVDECVPQAILEERALALAEECVQGRRGKSRKTFHPRSVIEKFMESFPGRRIVFSKARSGVLKNTKGFYPAPEKALDVIQKTYGLRDRNRALDIEAEAFCEVAVTEVSKHLIGIFYLTESVKKQNGVRDPNIKPRKVQHLGVLGAGTMGGGIAYIAADKGIHVRMKDISNEALALGYRSAQAIWNQSLQRKRINTYELQKRMSHVSGGLDYSGFHHLDVVVEAIVEDMNVKKKVIAEAASHCRPDCIMATNTSSLSVTEMAKGHPNPENFLGMHFFNPVHKMPLVEVIRGEKTSDEAVATIFQLSKSLGKTPVVVRDGPGFLVNRLLLPWMGEAIFMLQEGMGVESVDRIFTHKFGMPMGPFRLLDEVGLDVAIKVLKIFKESLGERIEMPEISSKILPTGRLGKKNGRGFYLYDEKGKQLKFDAGVYTELGLGSPKGKLTEKEVIERGIFSMVNEASLALIEDKIVDTPEEVDLAMIMGTGFPPFRGGLLRYADSMGTEYIAQELEEYATRFGRRFKPSQPLTNLAKNNRKFYQ